MQSCDADALQRSILKHALHAGLSYGSTACARAPSVNQILVPHVSGVPGDGAPVLCISGAPRTTGLEACHPVCPVEKTDFGLLASTVNGPDELSQSLCAHYSSPGKDLVTRCQGVDSFEEEGLDMWVTEC